MPLGREDAGSAECMTAPVALRGSEQRTQQVTTGHTAFPQPKHRRPRQAPPHILIATLRFSPSFGSKPVNLALANSNAVTIVLAGPSHNSAVEGSIRNRHTFGSLGPPGHHTSSVFRQTAAVFSASRTTHARPVIDR